MFDRLNRDLRLLSTFFVHVKDRRMKRPWEVLRRTKTYHNSATESARPAMRPAIQDKPMITARRRYNLEEKFIW